MIKRLQKRAEAGDPLAIGKLGSFYLDGQDGYPQNYTKALELFNQASELGSAEAHCSIGYSYHYGIGVEIDKKKGIYYYELAAMRGSVSARHNLGNKEAREGNFGRAIKHFMIAVGSGDSNSLKVIKELYSNGHATKENYTKALQSYQEYLGEIKSTQRDEAAAANDLYRYY